MKHFTLALLCFATFLCSAQQESDSTAISEAQYKMVIDSINNSFTYKYGTVSLKNDLATLEVPDGFKFLDSEQSNYVLTELWGNPPNETLGMLLPEDMSPMQDDFTYCVEITYSQEGYIDDEDAADLDYDDLLEEMQNDTNAANPERIAQGYGGMEFVGWASKPFYDASTKKLHWAKEIKFDGYDVNTLNYNIRVLGRRGYLNLNAIGDIDVLYEFNKDRDVILSSVAFNGGNQYSDFNPDLDEVAAYGIGGLIAGKVLAKVGLFAGILKFWKFIAIGAVAAFGGLRKRIFGGSSKEDA
jgi:uncharacterized membrane-anchored protein